MTASRPRWSTPSTRRCSQPSSRPASARAHRSPRTSSPLGWASRGRRSGRRCCVWNATAWSSACPTRASRWPRSPPEEVHEACDLLDLLDTYVYQRAAENLSREQLSDSPRAGPGPGEECRVRGHRGLAGGGPALPRGGDVGRRESLRHAVPPADPATGAAVLAADTALRRAAAHLLAGPRHASRRRCSTPTAELLAETVHAHIERMRANVLVRLESAGPLLPGLDPLAVLSQPTAAVVTPPA